MCLYIDLKKHKNKQPIVAEKDIICYKVLEKLPNGTLRTPYREFKVNNTVLTASNFQIEPHESLAYAYIYRQKIEEGIHSFQNVKTATSEKKLLDTSLSLIDPTRIIIKEAIIPRGTKYWIGTDGDYCSEKIILKKKQLKNVSNCQ